MLLKMVGTSTKSRRKRLNFTRCRMMKPIALLIVMLVFHLLTIITTTTKIIVSASAQRDQVHFVAAQQRPWQRRINYSNYGHPQQQRRRDLSIHFLDFEKAMKDGRTRPWKVDRRSVSTTWTAKLIWMNVAAFALQVLLPNFTNWGIKRSELILRGQQLYRLWTPVFLHGGVGHLITNLSSLRHIGPEVEHMFGSGRFLGLYLAAGAAGNLVSAFGSPNPALGASGAVFGVLGAYAVFLMRHDWLLGREGEEMSTRLVQTAFANIALGFLHPSIDNWGHIGGFVGGGLMAYFFGPRLFITEYRGVRTVIDQPIWRLPRSLESIPTRMSDSVGQAVQRLRILQGNPVGHWPWQQQNERRRVFPRESPTRSVKPQRPPQ